MVANEALLRLMATGWTGDNEKQMSYFEFL